MPATRGRTALEMLVWVFALSFLTAVLHFGSQGAFLTAVTWTLVVPPACGVAYLMRLDRLDAESERLRDERWLMGARIATVGFVVTAATAGAVALIEGDGLEAKSRWMWMIAAFMGAKWSALFSRSLRAYQARESTNRRSLLSPIGEIA